MEILIIIVLAIGGWLFYKQVDKLNKDVVWLKKEIQETQTKVREIDGMMKKLSQNLSHRNLCATKKADTIN